MIRGMHAMFYSSAAPELRAFLRDKLGLDGTDVGDGWLIFDAPEALSALLACSAFAIRSYSSASFKSVARCSAS